MNDNDLPIPANPTDIDPNFLMMDGRPQSPPKVILGEP